MAPEQCLQALGSQPPAERFAAGAEPASGQPMGAREAATARLHRGQRADPQRWRQRQPRKRAQQAQQCTRRQVHQQPFRDHDAGRPGAKANQGCCFVRQLHRLQRYVGLWLQRRQLQTQRKTVGMIQLGHAQAGIARTQCPREAIEADAQPDQLARLRLRLQRLPQPALAPAVVGRQPRQQHRFNRSEQPAPGRPAGAGAQPGPDATGAEQGFTGDADGAFGQAVPGACAPDRQRHQQSRGARSTGDHGAASRADRRRRKSLSRTPWGSIARCLASQASICG